jgi:hypothetical protein
LNGFYSESLSLHDFHKERGARLLSSSIVVSARSAGKSCHRLFMLHVDEGSVPRTLLMAALRQDVFDSKQNHLINITKAMHFLHLRHYSLSSCAFL